MRKFLIIILFALIFITGCGKSEVNLTCTINENNDGFNKEALVNAYFIEDSLVKENLTGTITFEKESDANEYYQLLKSTTTSDYEVSIDGLVVNMKSTIDYSENEEKINIEDYKTTYTESGYTCK